MSTLLELTNKLIQKCGVTGGSLTTVSNAVGESARLVAWIDDVYGDLQLSQQRWNWMRSPVSFATVAGQGSYTPVQCGVSDLGTWKIESFRRYITSVGVRSETFLTNISYDSYRDTYLFGNMRLVQSDPRYIAEGPDRSLNLGIIPGDVGYTIVGDYFKAPSHLTLDADTPLMPVQYHMILVYGAMMRYGMYESAPEVYQEGQALYNAALRRLMRDQLEDITPGNTLA